MINLKLLSQKICFLQFEYLFWYLSHFVWVFLWNANGDRDWHVWLHGLIVLYGNGVGHRHQHHRWGWHGLHGLFWLLASLIHMRNPTRKIARAIRIMATSYEKVQWASAGCSWSNFSNSLLASNSLLFWVLKSLECWLWKRAPAIFISTIPDLSAENSGPLSGCSNLHNGTAEQYQSSGPEQSRQPG